MIREVRAVRTASDRLTAANFRWTSRDWTTSVNSAKGKGRWSTTIGSPHRSAARRITSGAAGKARPSPSTTAAASARCRDWMYSVCAFSSPHEQHSGGEDHLPAAEHHTDVRGLGDVHPAHRPVELARAGHHLGFPGQHPFQGQDLTDRQGGFQGLYGPPGLQGDGHGVVFPCSGLRYCVLLRAPSRIAAPSSASATVRDSGGAIRRALVS